MAKRKSKELAAVTEAAREAGSQLATFTAVEAAADQIRKAAEQKEAANNFSEFLLSGSGSKAIVKIGDNFFRIEG
jgi:hypothetical protein